MQFSLRTMFVLTTCMAFACAVLFAFPDMVTVPLLLALTIALPAVLTTFTIYGSGYLRTFCIGALFPATTTLCAVVYFLGYLLIMVAFDSSVGDVLVLEDPDSVYRWCAGTSWVFTIVVGLTCMGTRWLVAGKNRPR